MQMRKLGTTNLDIAPLVLGGNVFGWTADKETSFSLLGEFLEAGFNAIDTADVYSPAQVSLAWLMSRRSVRAPIASATRLTQLREIMKSVEVELTSEDLRELEE